MTAPILSNSPARRELALRLGVASLVLLIVCLPLAHVVALRTVGLLLAVACAGFLSCHPAENQPRSWPLAWVFALWLGAALLSLHSSPAMARTLTEIWDEIVKSALLFYAAYAIARNRSNARVWFLAAAASLLLLSSFAIIAWLLAGSWQAVGPVPALGDFNTSAITLLPLLALPVFAHWRQPLGWVALPLAAVTAILTLTAAALSLSRSFWLVSAIMLISATLVWSWKKQRAWQTAMRWVGGGLALLALLAFLVGRWRGLDLLYFNSRSVIYGPVLNHLQSAPLTGFGYGHESAQAWYRTHMVEAGVLHAHNIVLSYAEQMGLAGLFAIFGIFGGLGGRLFRRISDRNPYRASLAAIGLALVAGVFVKNNLDIFFTRHNLLLFFLCCGVLLGAAESEADQAPAAGP